MGKKRSALANSEEASPRSKQACRENLKSPDRSDTSTTSAAGSETEHAQDSPNAKTKTVVLYTTEQQAAAEDHVSCHSSNGKNVVFAECSDIGSLEEMTFEHCSRLDILVDTNMCTMLMEGERFNAVAKRKFEEFAERNTKVWVISKVAEDFEQLYHCIPKKIRRRCEEGSMVPSVAQTGMTGGTSTNSNIFGTYDGNQQVVHVHSSKDEETFTTTIDKENMVEKLLVEAYKGNVDGVKDIVTEKTIDIHTPGEQGRTAIMLAAQNRKLKVAKFLKEAGCDMTQLDDDGNNLLHVACIGGSRKVVKYLLSMNLFDIDKRGEMGMTPIMMAAVKGNETVFNLLIGENCDTSGVDANGDNIIHLACRGGDKEIVKHITSNKTTVDINSTGHLGRTAVMKAAAEAKAEIVHFLIISEGCDLTATDGQGNNVLHVACLGGNLESVQSIVQEEAVEIESKGRYDWTPVMMAAEQGHYKVFHYLVETLGCDLSHQDSRHNNIFHTAAIGGNKKIVKYLLERSVRGKQTKNKLGFSPVETAQHLHKYTIVNLMINGPDKNDSTQTSKHFR